MVFCYICNMSRKKKIYNIMVKQPKEQVIYGCSNPSVKDGSMCCDGNCSMCNYMYIVERRKIWK